MADWTRVCSFSDLHSGKKHIRLNDRFISIINHQGILACIDSVCFHMGGPLGAGDIEDVAGYSCIVCPWHRLKIDISDGKKLSHKILSFDPTGKPTSFQWEKSAEVFQRVHQVKLEASDVFVKLSTDMAVIQSDRYCMHESAARGLHSAVGAGADGKRTTQKKLN